MKKNILPIGGASVLTNRPSPRPSPIGWERVSEGRVRVFIAVLALFLCAAAQAQINSGSNGSDGALDFSGISVTTNIVIDMHDHPNGIYQYTYVNIPNGVTVKFIRNANNTPVYWLVQSNVVINGTLNLSGQDSSSAEGSIGGPGGFSGGNTGTLAGC